MTQQSRIPAPLAAAILALGLTACGGDGITNVSLGGTISGLTQTGLVLNDGVTNLTIAANATSFTFPRRLNEGSTYFVFVAQQPALQTCSIANNGGVVGNSDIKNVAVTCVPNNTLGGTVGNLRGTGLVLVNGPDRVTVAPPSVAGNDASFVFPTRVASGANYGVTILTQPTGQTCAVANGVGTMGSTDVSNVRVTCQ